jgi:hypothetical protein
MLFAHRKKTSSTERKKEQELWSGWRAPSVMQSDTKKITVRRGLIRAMSLTREMKSLASNSQAPMKKATPKGGFQFAAVSNQASTRLAAD